MNKSSLLISISLFLLILGGCKDSQNAQQQPTDQNKPETTNKTKQPQTFPNPIQLSQTTPPSALTPATDPDQRAKVVSKGSSVPNRNPFGLIIPPVRVGEGTISLSPLPLTGSPNLNGIEVLNNSSPDGEKTGVGNDQKTKPISKSIPPTKPSVSRIALNQTPTVKESIPSNIPIPPPPKMSPEAIPGGIPTNPNGQLTRNGGIPNLKPDFTFVRPPKPEPDQARAVAVTGIIEINGQKHAIVKSPGENHSRYVKVGDLLANGQVLVKRIDANKENPYIVLEQLGQEVPLLAGAGTAPQK